MNGIIYKAINLQNNKVYIGQTIKTLEQRINKHYYDASYDNLYFHKALNKYDKEDWKWEVIDEFCSFEELNSKEKYWIAYFNSNNLDKGYNLTEGGAGVIGLTKESYDKMRKTRINNSSNENYKQKEQKVLNSKKKNKAVRCLNTGIIYSCPEDAAKALEFKDLKNSANAIRKCARGDTKTARGFQWEYLSELEGREYSPDSVKLEETGEIFRSIRQASILTHQSENNIRRCCNKLIQDNAGYHWSWVNKDV